MKNKVLSKGLLIALLTMTYFFAQAQVAVKTNNTNPDPSAMLDVEATDKGMLIPRMTQAQRNAIATPATGLMVFQTDASAGFYYYDGAAWSSMGSSGDWKLTGNAGTDPANNKLGTTDNQPLNIAVNDNVKWRFTEKGQLEFLNDKKSVAIGKGALFSNTTGSGNTANGYQALYWNTEGNNNTANGTSALYHNTTGINNTANGLEALFYNTTGSNNAASGTEALTYNTTGDNNTANGTKALYTNTTGNNNMANGYQALYNNTTGDNNTANGYSALYNNTTGSHNSANGFKALYKNTEGNYNIANGLGALFYNTTGDNNTANGHSALFGSTTGDNNTANGVEALFVNTTGNNNTATGYQALHWNKGNSNTAMGKSALYGNETGKNNTAVGSGALKANLGSWNTAIGFDAYSTSSFTNSVAIGAATTVTASHQIRLGHTNITSIGGVVGWSTVSDRRFKKDIQEQVPGLDFVLKLRPVTYHLDQEAIARFRNIPDSLRQLDREHPQTNNLKTGFIAQEVEEAAKLLGFDFSGVDAPKNDKDNYSLRYAAFVVPLVKAVQEQQATIETQNVRIEKLEAAIQSLLKNQNNEK